MPNDRNGNGAKLERIADARLLRLGGRLAALLTVPLITGMGIMINQTIHELKEQSALALNIALEERARNAVQDIRLDTQDRTLEGATNRLRNVEIRLGDDRKGPPR